MRKANYLLLLLCFLLLLPSCGLFSDPNEGKSESEAILTHWNEENNALVITLSESEYFVFAYDAREDLYNYVGEWYKGGDCFPVVLQRESEQMNCGISFEKQPDAWSYGFAIHKITDLASFLGEKRGYSSEFAYMEHTEFLATVEYKIGKNRFLTEGASQTATVTVEQRKLAPELYGFVDPLWKEFRADAETVRFVSERGSFEVSGATGRGIWTVGDREVAIHIEFLPETPAFVVYDVSGDAPKQILFAVGRMEDSLTFVTERYSGTMFYSDSVHGLTVVRAPVP